MSRPKTVRERQNGFTLLEILIALAILGIALTAIIKAASSQSMSTIHLKEKTFAHWLAVDQITELQLTNQWPSKGTQQGDKETGPFKWHWVRTVTGTPDERVRMVEIAIYRDRKDEHSVTRLVSFLAQPM